MIGLKNKVLLREMQSSDESFIFSSWLKSFRNSNFAKSINNTIYYKAHHKIIEGLLETSKVIIACNREDPDQILGYIVAEMIDGIFTIHYTYVKSLYRHMGVGKYMLNSFGKDRTMLGCYTHDTYVAAQLAPKYNLVHHPYLMVKENIESELLEKSGEAIDESSERIENKSDHDSAKLTAILDEPEETQNEEPESEQTSN